MDELGPAVDVRGCRSKARVVTESTVRFPGLLRFATRQVADRGYESVVVDASSSWAWAACGGSSNDASGRSA